MTSQPIRTRVIGCIELVDPSAPVETWEQLVSGAAGSEHDDLVIARESRGQEERGAERGRAWSGCGCTRIPADVVQLRGELENEFHQLCLQFLGADTPYRAE